MAKATHNVFMGIGRFFRRSKYQWSFNGEIPDGENKIDIDRLAFLICRGGWPKSLDKKTDTAALIQVQEYYEAVVNSDISRVDNTSRNPELAKG